MQNSSCKRSFVGALAMAGVVMAWLSPSPASASLVIQYASGAGNSNVLSGTPPAGSGAFATATITDLGGGTFQFNIQVSSTPTGLYVDEIGFNLSAPFTNIVAVSGVQPSSASFNAAGIPVNGTGNEKFTANYPYPNAGGDRLGSNPGAGLTSVFNLTGLAGLTESTLLTGNVNGLISAIHLAGYGNSVGISGTEVRAVPEPSTLATAGLGCLTLAGYGLRSRRRRSPSDNPAAA
jgi:hypothetical protein